MKKLFVFIVLSFLITSCASYHQLMVGPDGSIQDCNATGQGVIGMAVASSHVNGCRDNLKKAGYLEIEKAGVIGIKFRSDSTVVLQVLPNSPASKSSIKAGDKIISIEDQPIYTPKDAQILLFGEARTTVKLQVKSKVQTTTLFLERAPYTEVYGMPEN